MLAPTDTNIADCPVASRSYSIMIQADEPNTLPIDTGVPSFGKATDFTSAPASYNAVVVICFHSVHSPFLILYRAITSL